MGRAVRSVLIDNYDSYTYNLYHLLAEVNGEEPVLVRNDDFESYEDFVALVGGVDHFDNVVISPGPGRPERRKDFGGCSDVLQGTHVPVLGVCLGHQGICTTYGAKVVHAAGGVAHGVISPVQHDGEAIFRGVPDSFHVVRYHSLAVDAETLPACLKPVAWCKGVDSDAQVLMGVRHESRPLFGVQFHPESICTAHGRALLENFRDLTAFGSGRASPLPHPVLSKRRTPRLVADDGGPGSGRVLGTNVQLDEHPARSMQIRWRKIVYPAVAAEESFTETLFTQLYANAVAPQFWLDSPPAARGCRFSYMGDGSGPYAEVVSCDVDGRTSVLDTHGNVVEGPCDASIFSVLERRLRSKAYEGTNVFPFRLNCGYVGYLGYELKTQCGASQGHHRSEVPNATMLFADRVVVIDHSTAEVYMLCAGYGGAEEDAEAERWFAHVQAAVEVADRVAQVEMDSDEAVEASMPDEHSSRGRQHPPPTFQLERDCNSYLEDIRECLREIYEGETYEVCLTNRLRSSNQVDAFSLYKTMRRRNDAPYSAFLRLAPDVSICCSSPERFLKVDTNGDVESRPIKGTRKRGKIPEEDEKLKSALKMSEKERAENLMIVDLVRHDLGRVSQAGSVCVPSLMKIESYKSVHQMVSTVRAKLEPGQTGAECLRAAFPMGSMTGAPKLRTMQIIDRIEHSARGIYSGCVGFLALNGAVDTNVVIRSAVVTKTGVEIGAGGAITAKSDPDEEFEEMLIKARALMEAVALTLTNKPDYRISGL